jgi:glycosyltransferase involved in cell wall biosynthesis
VEIAFFTESYLPTRDGVAQVTSSLAKELARQGHGVRVYAPSPGAPAPGAPAVEEVTGVRVVRVASVPSPLYPQYRWAVFPFARLAREHLGREVDILHVHTPGIVGSAGFLSARALHKPVVGTFHTNVWAMRSSFPPTPLVRLFFRMATWYTLGTYWRCDVTTAPTPEARDALLGRAEKPFRRPVEVVPNGIEVGRFHPGVRSPDWRERCALPDGPLVTYLGRLTEDKGVFRFLDAVRSLPSRASYSAVVAGTGPAEAEVRRRIHADRRLAERVRFVGPVAEEEKAALLSQSELFVLPSTSDTSSVVLLEAMASGAACVALDVGGPKDLIADGINGRLVPPQPAGSLSEAIGELLEDAGRRRRLAAGGVEYVRRSASIELTARRFISLYEMLLSERGLHGAGQPR